VILVSDRRTMNFHEAIGIMLADVARRQRLCHHQTSRTSDPSQLAASFHKGSMRSFLHPVDQRRNARMASFSGTIDEFASI
jgi:hypothetical protein